MGNALLVAEAEPDERGYLSRHLTSDGFDVVAAARAGEALDLAERRRPDLVVVGNPLADMPAVELCARIRTGEPGRRWDPDVPVVVIDRDGGDAVDRVRALENGCDDYLARPYAYEELRARIRAILRRAQPSERDRMAAGALVIDRGARRVTIAGVPVALSGKEYELLLRLAQEPTRVFTKEQLLKDVWGFRSACRTRTLDSHASRLRRKLAAADPEGDELVVNVWGVGYKLVEG